MNSEKYREGVLRTESGRFDFKNVTSSQIIGVFGLFVAASKAMDALKRALYYGKPLNESKLKEAFQSVETTLEWCKAAHLDNAKLAGYNETPSVTPRAIHAAMGLSTEAGELIEAIVKSLENNVPLDKTNYLEELGDAEWYLALGMEAEGLTHEQVWEKCLAKLAKRYPEKFSTEAAFNRNISEEIKALNATCCEHHPETLQQNA